MNKSLQTYFFLGFLGLILILIFFMFIPFTSALILAITFGIIFSPLYAIVLKFMRGQRSLASLLTILIILVIVLIPITVLSIKIFNQAQSLYFQITSGDSDSSLITRISTAIETRVRRLFPSASFSIDLNRIVGQFSQWLIKNIGPIFSSLAQVITSILLAFLALYYLFKDGPKLRQAIFKLSPLSESHNYQVFSKLKTTVYSVIRGYLIVAIVQGILAGIGFTIFGIPNAVLWGALTVIAALVPILGTSLIVIPAIAYLFITGHTASAIGLLIWGATAVGLIDNFLGPKLIGRGAQIHPFFILISVLGGISLFGPIGFLAGPISFALFFALLDIYPVLVLQKNVAE